MAPATAERTSVGPRRAVAIALASGAVVALAWGVCAVQAPPSGPAPVAWDRVRCARCSMLVSEPGFAAQLQQRDGTVLHFDDPGCLLLHRDEQPERDVHAVWLHLHETDAWILEEDARFAAVPTSPMGYGLATRSARAGSAEAGTLGAAEALERARARDRQRRRGSDDGAP